MTPYERVMTALSFAEPDRVPLVLSARFACLKYAGYTLADCYEDNDKYVFAQEKFIDDFHTDAVWDLAGVYYISRALGQKMMIPEDDPPAVLAPYITLSKDIEKLANFKFENTPIFEYHLDTNRKLRERLGSDYPLISYCFSPFYLAVVLGGTVEVYKAIYKDPAFVKDLIECTLGIVKRYSSLLIKEGGDILYTACPQASRAMISREIYQEFVHPTFMDLFDYWRNELNKKILFHVCGDWSDRFDLLIEEQPDILHVDQIDLKWLKEICDRKVTINGNVSTTKTLLTGTPDEVEAESLQCIKSAAMGGGFLLGADCTLGKDTPVENVKAMTRAVAKYGSYPIG